MVVASHVTSYNEWEYIISAYNNYGMLKFVFDIGSMHLNEPSCTSFIILIDHVVAIFCLLNQIYVGNRANIPVTLVLGNFN